MKMFVLASSLIIALAIGGSALAQLDPDEDGIGVYFDPCACVNCVPMEPGPQQAYIVVTHPTSQRAGVGGWEAKIWLTGPAIITNTTFEGNSLNFLTPPEYLVGIQIPLYNPFMYPAVVVGTFDFQLLDDTEPVNWYIDAIYRHSLPEPLPAYLDGDDYNIIIPMQTPTGGLPGRADEIPVATINGSCAVPAEPMSWGEVKTLYR